MSDTFNRLKPLFVNLRIDEDKIVPEAKLFDDLNFDSLDSVEIVIDAEEEFDIVIEDADVDNFETIQDIITYIDERI
jgi:acyl carrier protein